MFTGIITDVGRIISVTDEAGSAKRLEIETAFDMETVTLGASIACAGACLTVTEKGTTEPGTGWFVALASAETLSKTTLGTWDSGTLVNLERAMVLGDEFGGHMVSGHVDGLARVVSIEDEGGSKRITFEVADGLSRFIAPKGSASIDGVSLTVNGVKDTQFDVNVIPHTLEATTLGGLLSGDTVNLEIDLLARYVARLLDKS